MGSTGLKPLRILSDRELVLRIRAGDRMAFRQLYERYFPRVYRFVDLRTRSRAQTEAVVEDVFTCMVDSLDDPEAESSFTTWLFELAQWKTHALPGVARARRPGRRYPRDAHAGRIHARIYSTVAAGPPPSETRIRRMAISEDGEPPALGTNERLVSRSKAAPLASSASDMRRRYIPSSPTTVQG